MNTNSNNELIEDFGVSLETKSHKSEDSNNIKGGFSNPENIGLLFAALSTFSGAFGAFFTKLIQRTYPHKFHTVPFLFLRSFTIIILASMRARYSNESILKLSEIKDRMWFFFRTNMNFFGMSSMTMAIWYLRTATAQIINSTNPIIVLILSYFILKEQFYFRYIIGVVMCIIGSLFIVLNERDANKPSSDSNDSNIFTPTAVETLYGVCFACFSACTVSVVIIANKVLVNNKVSINSQMFYVGMSTMTYSTIYIIFFGGVELDIGYLAMCSFHGLFFFFGNIFYNMALQRSPLSKLILVSYLNVVFVFILSFIFLHERIFITDIFGAIIILSYLLYQAYNPPTKTNK